MTSFPARVSKKRGGNTTRESETPGTESPKESATLETAVSEASELLAPSRPGLSSVAGQVKASGAQSTWPIRDGRVKASGSPVVLACHHPAMAGE